MVPISWDASQSGLFRVDSVVNSLTGDTIYADSKYAEMYGQTDGEAKPVYIYLPRPKCDVDILITGRYQNGATVFGGSTSVSKQFIDTKARQVAEIAHPRRVITQSTKASPIYITIVAEGYTEAEMPKFRRQSQELVESLFAQEAFGKHRDCFQITALELPSKESGISRPSKGVKLNTALGAHFDSYSLDRLITVADVMEMARALEGMPLGHVMILANTNVYGGSGPHNEYAIGYAGGKQSHPVILHEFGHSFGRLGDEYDDGYVDMYTSDCEPDEPNITTMHDFSGKWQNLIDSGKATLIEGAGYQKKGVWRGTEKCLMRTVACPDFCPVCTQALERLIELFTEEQ